MLDSSLIAEIDLTPDDFSVDSHRQVYDTIQGMIMAGEPVDAVIVAERLEGQVGSACWQSPLFRGRHFESVASSVLVNNNIRK